MKFSKSLLFLAATLLTISCGTNTDDDIETPETYEFTRNGESTVSFSGQTIRIKMATELSDAMLDFDNSTEELLLEMYRNQTANGDNANPFSDAELNASSKSIKSKVAASQDLFSQDSETSLQIKNQFETWISAQINEVFPNENVEAQPGIAGQIADGTSTRYVNGKGLEYNQLVAKSLIGALMGDQMMNNYLSPAVLDAGANVPENDNKITVEGESYTNMEHKWDEAYGYLFGLSSNPANPLTNLGEDDFLNKYLGRVEGDSDFEGIAQEIFDAFALGRAAIMENDYTLRNIQSSFLRGYISRVIGIRAVYYLEAGADALSADPANYGTAFHDLSEAYGFIYSLQFARVPGAPNTYFSKAEVDNMLAQLEEGNGLWDVTPETLRDMSTEIASRFSFTVEQAAN